MAMVLVPWNVTIIGLGIDMMMICMVIMHLEAIPEEIEGAWIMVAVLEVIVMVMEWTALVMDVAVIIINMMATALVVTQTSAVAIIDMVEVMNVIHMVVMAMVIGVIGAGGEEIVTMIEWDMEAITIAIMDMVA